MKYNIAYTEIIPHIFEGIEAENPSAAIEDLFSKFENGKATRITSVDERADCQIINIRDEEGNEFAFFDYQLKQWRWRGHGLTEARALGLTT